MNFSTLAVVLASSSNAAAQAQTPTPTQPPPAVEPSVAAYSDQTPEWKQAMTLYDLGEVEQSLSMLRTKILSCDKTTTSTCTNVERAALFMCVGIVLSGGQSNHNGGVQAFKKALSLDPQMRVAPEYSTAPVTNAFSEAFGGKPTGATAVSPPQVQKPTPVASTENYDEGLGDDDDDDDDDEPKFDPEKKRLYWLATGGARYGLASGGGGGVQLGGALGLAGVPGETSGFTLGARVRSGVLISDGTLGYIGTQMLVGSTSGERKNNRYNFIFGGVGFENYFEQDSSALTGHFLAGTSLGGFILAGGVDVAISSEVAYAIFGIEVGFGTLIL